MPLLLFTAPETSPSAAMHVRVNPQYALYHLRDHCAYSRHRADSELRSIDLAGGHEASELSTHEPWRGAVGDLLQQFGARHQ